MNLLMIALEFPPTQTAGAFRPLRYATHLPDSGIKPIVVCFPPWQLNYPTNARLASQLPHKTPVYHLDVKALKQSPSTLSVSNPPTEEQQRQICPYEVSGRAETVEELLRLIQRDHQIDAIYATLPPFNADIIARRAKEFFQRPLLVDMRDAWSLWGSTPFRTWFHYRTIRRREQQLLRAADRVVSVTPQLVEMERQVEGKVQSDKYHWIPNAYDKLSLTTSELTLPSQLDCYKISYVGNFYYNDRYENEKGIIPWYQKRPHRWFYYHPTRQRWIYRTPLYFFRAWKRMRERYPELQDRLEFHYVGDAPAWLPEMSRKCGVGDKCVWHGVLDKHETQQKLEKMDAMLSTSIKVLDGEDYCLASKTFDYIEAGKPILGFVASGSQQEFLRRSNSAVLFEPDEIDQNADRLRGLINDGFQTTVNADYLSSFSAASTTRRLSEVLRDMTGRKSLSDKSAAAVEPCQQESCAT